VPSNNVTDFVSYLKANQKTLYASSGVGAPNHLGVLLFLSLNNVTDAVHTPYQGGGPAMVDVVAGRVKFSMQTMTAVKPMAAEQRIKVLAIASEKRSPLMPDVPTFTEAGLAKIDFSAWFAILAPAATPAPVLEALNKHIVAALQSFETRAKLVEAGFSVLGTSRADTERMLKSEAARWAALVKATGFKGD
jgi:tripartite-type tricarboxylate transporter receptor subunit TctC